MVRISTTYDKDIKKKVFQVRGDEAYARATSTTLTLGSITTGSLNGLKISSITVDVYNTLGRGNITLYNGDDALPNCSTDIVSSDHQETFSNIYLGYGYTHQLWAKYTPLEHQCLPSKSKKVTVHEDVPASLKTKFTKDSGSTQVNSGSNVTFQFTVKVGSETAPTSMDVNVYIDNEYETTLNPDSSGIVSTGSNPITGLSDGKHTIELRVDDTSSYYGATYSYSVCVGYNITLSSLPTYVVDGQDNDIVVMVYDWNNNPINNNQVTLYNSSNVAVSSASTTNANGVATITITSISASGQYYIKNQNNTQSSPFLLYKLTPNAVTLTAPRNVVAINQTLPVTATVTGDNNPIPNATVTFKCNSTTFKTMATNSDGIATTEYTGDGKGFANITATANSIQSTKAIDDVITYWTSDVYYNMNRLLLLLDTSIKSYQNYLEFTGTPIRFGIEKESSSDGCEVMLYVREVSAGRTTGGISIYMQGNSSTTASTLISSKTYYKLEFKSNTLRISKSETADFTTIPNTLSWTVVSEVTTSTTGRPIIQIGSTTSPTGYKFTVAIPKLRVSK